MSLHTPKKQAQHQFKASMKALPSRLTEGSLSYKHTAWRQEILLRRSSVGIYYIPPHLEYRMCRASTTLIGNGLTCLREESDYNYKMLNLNVKQPLCIFILTDNFFSIVTTGNLLNSPIMYWHVIPLNPECGSPLWDEGEVEGSSKAASFCVDLGHHMEYVIP